MQCQSIDAGNSIRLLRKALGEGQVPEILETIRQDTERDRETALMFRNEQAAEALARKEEDGTLVLAPGGYKQAVEAAVDLLLERRKATAGIPKYDVVMSAPTNADVMAVGEEVRRRRQVLGEVGPDQVTIDAADQSGHAYKLALAVGDRLRLFNRVRDGHGDFGVNGSVVKVLQVHPSHGLTLENDSGRVSVIPWEKVRNRDTGVIQLAYGDALTIDARQGDTVYEHITVIPAGSSWVNGFKAYTTESRHRVKSWIVASLGEEMLEIFSRRPLGDPRNILDTPAQVREAVIANMARNMSQHPHKLLATDFIEAARDVTSGTVSAQQAAWHGRAQPPRTAQWQPQAQTTPPGPQPPRQPPAASPPAPVAAPATPPRKPPQEPKRMSPMEVQAAFAAALQASGMLLKGPPVMDGRWHRVAVDGDKGAKKSGSYKGWDTGGLINNFKGGKPVPWKPTGSTGGVSAAERQQQTETARAERVQRQLEKAAREAAGADQAKAVWAAANPASPDHPYLARKQIDAEGLRQAPPGQTVEVTDGKKVSIGGRLIVPLRDIDGRMWNVQLIDQKGGKLFLPGRKSDLFFAMGRPDPNAPLLITEGMATAKTVRNTTSLTTVAAIDTSNLRRVAAAIRTRHPDQPIVLAADNDHHLPLREKPLPNAGIEKAKAAAEAVGGAVVIPKFDPADPGTDWNDIMIKWGRDAVRKALEEAFAAEGLTLPPMAAQQPEPKQTSFQAKREEAWLSTKTKHNRRGSRQQAAEAERLKQNPTTGA